jgi:predicted PurR-regulated permease PerM
MAKEPGRPKNARPRKAVNEVRITVPRWAQAIFVPLGIILVIYFGRSLSHAIFVFLMAMLIALLLNPLVAAMNKLKVPRALGVSLVYLTFIAALVVALVVAVPPVAHQFRGLLDNLPQIQEGFNRMLDNLQAWLASLNITVDLQAEWNGLLSSLEQGWASLAGALFNFSLGVVGGIATFVVIVFTSFYMLIDGRRIHRFLCRLVPASKGTAERYLLGLQTSFSRYVRGQAVLGLAVGMASGLGVWILGWQVVGIWPEGAQYALLFGVWAGITELVPYIGPWVGAIPPVLLAFFHSPGAALWVALVYLLVQQLEGHILVPNIMGSSVGVHPLVVIFAVLAGAQVGGILGMLAVLPLLAMAKWTADFFEIKFSRSPWLLDDGVSIVAREATDSAEGDGSGRTADAGQDAPDPDSAPLQASAEPRGE